MIPYVHISIYTQKIIGCHSVHYCTHSSPARGQGFRNENVSQVEKSAQLFHPHSLTPLSTIPQPPLNHPYTPLNPYKPLFQPIPTPTPIIRTHTWGVHFTKTPPTYIGNPSLPNTPKITPFLSPLHGLNHKYK